MRIFALDDMLSSNLLPLDSVRLARRSPIV
jgi:hypothetical protein